MGLSKSPSSTSPSGAPTEPVESALQQQLSKPALTANKIVFTPTQQPAKQLDSSFGSAEQGSSADSSKTTNFILSSPSVTPPNFRSVPKLYNTTIFKLSPKLRASPATPNQAQQQQPAPGAFDSSSSTGFSGSKATTNTFASSTQTIALSFGESSTPQQLQQQGFLFGATQPSGLLMFDE
ncbi:hypothetical protein QAD02_007750 [Eretmocerus hayati]|uniref:Uncharacterized protein n=1 Tax=Eretmocerus hayati TaxID=131215 RepID=A0ACC2N579_9HYME|nr:hypothetical protein QAD02_007750 [Eretmocerus hayati]